MTQPTTDSSAERQKGSAVNQLTASPGKGQAQGREPDQKASSEDHTKAAIETRQPKSAEGEVEEEEEDEEDEDIPIVDYSKKPETSADVSSTIMLQIPTYNLANLRKEFEAEPDGLNLTQFVRTFVRNMNLEDDEAMLNIIPDLVNFFNLVDINGDGHMEWSEFVMFVIEQVVKGDDTKVYEELQLVERVQIQPPSSREIVSCAKFIVELNKLVLAVGDEVQVYETDESSSSWMGEPLKIKSRKKETINASVDSMGISGSFSKGGVRERVNRKLEESLRILDLVYIGSADILVILRNDMVLEFLKFTSRAKNSSDVVIHFGMQFLPKSYNRIVCRDVKKQSVILFALDNTEFVHCFDVDVGPIGPVKIRPHHKNLDKHTDFVRDVLVVSNDSYSLVVTAGLDRKVLIWDLSTLNYRATRTGSTAGIECLAFDGKSTLYAGGYDHRIIVWDLDAQIDMPIFFLEGHNKPICKIIARDCDRCVSLDTGGEFRLWDTSKSSTADNEARVIDQLVCNEDRARTLEIINRPGGHYPSLHGLIVLAEGRYQHVCRIADTSVKESTPLAVLFSCQLMIVATVHTKEVIIRNVITGDIQLVINELGGSVSEVHCAVLDDRERKIVLGFSNGVISEYNCLNGLRIKSFPPLHGSIKHLLYSPDRVIIAVVGTGDIIVLDDSALDDQGSKNSMLREVKAHEKDITCIAYSHKLGLFATADMFGTLKLWNFQYLTTELVIKNCPSMDIGSLTFLDPFPLLLVADNSSSFSIFPVGRAYSYFQRQFWKLEPFVARQQKKSKGNRSVSSTSNKGDASVGSVSSPTDRKKSVGSISLSNSEENRSASSAQSLFSAGEETDAEDDEDGKQKPFTKKRMRRYLRAKRELKTLVVHQFTTTSQSGNDDKDSDDDETYAWSKLFASSSSDDSPPELKRKSRGRGNDNSSLMSNKRDSTQDNISIESSAPHPLKLLDSMRSGKDLNDGFPAGLKIVAVCGHDDGTIAIFDLTSAIQSIDFPPLQASQEVPRELSYDPRKLVSIRSNVDNSRTIWSNDDLLEGETVEATELETAWLAHRGSINNLTIMGDFRDIVSCGEDHCVNIFSFEGYAKGYLTRSRELDKLIRPRWRNPVDMQRRARLRRREARKLIKDLNLQRSTTKNQFLLDPFSDEDPDVRGAKLKMGLMEVLDPNTSLPIVATDTQLAGTITVSVGLLGDQLQQSHQNLQFTDHSLSKVTGNGKQGEDCERTRILEQFRGKVTYDRSQKEIAKEQAMIAIKKHAEEVENSSLKLRKEKKKAKRRAKVLKGDEPTGAAYLNELMYGGDIKMIKPQRKRRPGELEVSERLLQPVGPRRLKTKYDTEIDQIDQQDPRNWDISSSNRQREFYQRLHIEMDKRGTSKDPMRVIEHKLNTLSPNGDFRAFAQMIKKKRHKARRSLQSRSSASLKNQDVEQANLKSSATMPMATVASPTQTLCLIGTKDLESRTMDGEFADNFVSNVYPDGGNHTSLATKLKQDQPANIVISRNLLENAEQKDCHSGTQKLEEAEGQQNQNLSQEEKLAIENLVSTHKLNIIISNSFSINPELNMTLSAPAPPLTNLFNSPVYEKSKATSPSNQGSSTSPNASTRKNSNKSRNSSPGGGSIKPGKMQRHSFSRSAGEGITERHTQRDSVGRMSFHGLAEISLGSLASSINTRKLDQKHAKLHEHAHTFEHITQKDCEHAMAAQRSTMTALSIFEQEVKKTETLYRRAKLQLKKDKKKAKTLAKSQSLAPISSISIDRNRFTGLSTAASLESLGSNKTPKSNNSSQQKKLGDGPNTRSLPTLRHSTAKMMLKNQSSVEGLLQVGHKKRAVETNIERKIAYTIRAYGLDVGGSKIEGQGNVLARLLEDQKDTKGIVTESLRINKYISRSPMFRNKHRAKSLMNSSRDSIDTGRSYSQDYSTNNSMDEIERQEEMKLRDTYFDYVDDKTTRLNLLHMLNHHTIASRPQYHLALTQLLHHKQCDFFEAGLEIPAQEITATMSEIVHHMEPYMSPAERIQSAKYLRVFVEEEIKSHAAKDNLSIEQVEMLHSLFSFFDKDKSGQIEVAELMAVLKKTTENRIKEESELLLSGAELPLNSGWDVNEDSIVRMIQSVDSDANLELNFEEFLELFKNCLE